MVKYEIWEREIERHAKEIEQGLPFPTTIRDDNMVWMKVEAIVSRSPVEGGEPAAILGDSSGVREKGQWHVRILKTLSDEELLVEPGV